MNIGDDGDGEAIEGGGPGGEGEIESAGSEAANLVHGDAGESAGGQGRAEESGSGEEISSGPEGGVGIRWCGYCRFSGSGFFGGEFSDERGSKERDHRDGEDEEMPDECGWRGAIGG